MLQQAFCLVLLTFACTVYVSHERPVTASSLRVIWLQVLPHPIPIIVDANNKFMGTLSLDNFQRPQTSQQKPKEPSPLSSTGTTYSTTPAKETAANVATKQLSNKPGSNKVVVPNKPAVAENKITKQNTAGNKGMEITLTGQTVEISAWAGNKADGKAAVDSATAKVGVDTTKPSKDVKLVKPNKAKSPAQTTASSNTTAAQTTTVAANTTAVTSATTTVAPETATAAFTGEPPEMTEPGEFGEMIASTPSSNGAAGPAAGGEALEPIEVP